jgi:predicted SAM-dependent methyltransferase
MILNLGCGSVLMPGAVNVDVADVPGVDFVWDLDDAPWPFLEAYDEPQVSEIFAKDVFEHVANPITFMSECHRVLAPGGVLHIRTPYFRSIDAFTDPTHRRFPTEYTFDYWVRGTVLHGLHNAAYGGVSFELEEHVRLDTDGGSLLVDLRKL